MKTKLTFSVFYLFVLVFFSCGGKTEKQAPTVSERLVVSKQAENIYLGDKNPVLQSLDELADLERAGSWLAGMALTESGLRENTGDYAGAVTAVYKELAYAYGMGLIQKGDIELCLSNILDARNDEEVTVAVNTIMAFTKEQWSKASDILKQIINQFDEPDGFGNWMILSCNLETNNDDRASALAYKAIRARYMQFPEYWYRGARTFTGAVSAEYAENCINISPEGPFADECRGILAAYTGLNTEDGLSIRTKKEIETAISKSINAGNPELLDILLPLIGLPDNPYTIYATGALRALTSVPNFRDYFNKKASGSRGRLAERLLYISRG